MRNNPMLKYGAKSFVPLFVFSAALIIYVLYLVHNRERFALLIDLSVGKILLMLLLIALSMLGTGVINHFFYRGLGARLSFNESFGLGAVNALGNQLPFIGVGVAVKGIYLKRVYGLSYVPYLGTTLTMYFLLLAANGLLGVTDLLFLSFLSGTKVNGILFWSFALMTLCSLFILVIPDQLPLPNKLRVWERHMMKSRSYIIRDLSRFIWIVLVQLVMTVLYAGRLLIVFHMLSQEVSFAQCILFSSAAILTQLVNITPGGLGIREAIVAAIASILGYDAGISVIAVGLDRLIALTLILLVGVAYSYILGKKSSEATNSSTSSNTFAKMT